MKTDDILTAVGETTEYGRLYIQQEKDLLKLEFAEKIATTTSSLISIAVISLFGLIAFLFFSLTAGLYLAQLLGSYPLAFLIISLVFLVLAVGVYFFKNKVIAQPIYSLISNEILGEKYEDKTSLKTTSEITRQEFAQSIGSNRNQLKTYLIKRIGLPIGIVSAVLGGMAIFSSKDKLAFSSKNFVKSLLPLFINLATAYFADKKTEKVSGEAVHSQPIIK